MSCCEMGSKNISRKVKAYLSSVVERRLSNRHKLSAYPVEEDYSRVIFRITVNRDKRLRVQTNVYVPVSLWNEIDENVKSGEEKRVISSLKTKLEKVLEIYVSTPEVISKEWLECLVVLLEDIDHTQITRALIEELLDRHNNPEKYVKLSFFDLFERYLKETKYSEVREKNMRVLIRALQRYEWFTRLSKKNSFELDVETISKDTIYEIEDFLRNEHLLLDRYPEIFEAIPANTDKRAPKKPKARGNNTICALFNKLRAFFNWCNENHITANRPFLGYRGVTVEKYGSPIYITQEERNHIADFDLSAYPALEVQRDIFIFQCLIGCRVSDLLRLTEADIIDGAVNYIPRKTKENDPVTTTVPIKGRAEILLKKYKGVDATGRIFPFISAQKYNDSIKEIFRLCGVTRIVTVLNPTTGNEEKRPINEVASSHMARRTFAGNLYKKVKDPNLIASMTGHKPGSTAFARYRNIDMDIKTEMIDLLNE